ncbi:MAG TPA: response regulator [Thermoanaerobaculia bacterium]|nr:response regulator [Thermoanaerobaculia bacterium]
MNVDDNDASLYAKTRVLRRAGFEVVEANRGANVMPLVATHQPDLVLLDVNLPDVSGYDLCRQIKSHPDHAATIVVQISASFVDRNDRMRGFEAGADSYFTEPMEPEELVANVAALLRIRQMETELRRSAIEWQQTFNAVHDGVAILLETGTISRCNPAFDRLAGGASVGKRIDQVLFPDGSEPLKRLLADAAATSSSAMTELQLGDRSLRLSIDPVLDTMGQTTHFACILADVTAEHEIAKLNDQLRTTVESLRRAKLHADAASRAKDDFLATLSHELRTPMTSIVGWAQMLKMFGANPQSAIEAADAILGSAQVQSQLVEDLLDLSRITTGKLHLETDTLPLAEVVEAAVQTIVPAANAKRITIEKDLDAASVLGDRTRLRQVVWNLVSNAVKFTPDGGHISVTLRTRETRAVIEVRDNGQGIDADFLPAVFDRFSQAEALTNRSKSGLGLGLAIVRHIVELHGGEVTVASDGPGKGATFCVLLPLVAGSGVAMKRETMLPRLEGRRVLVVDDTQASLTMFATFLRAAGATVFAASSAEQALLICGTEAVDAIVTDLAMPGENGLALIRALRSDPLGGHANVAIIAMTAMGNSSRTEALAAGATAFLEKPAGPADLVRLLAGL